MSIENAKLFMERLMVDADFRDRINSVVGDEMSRKTQILRMARAEGFEFDDNDIDEAKQDIFAIILKDFPDPFKQAIFDAGKLLAGKHGCTIDEMG
jgi:predicted ribosomally synthesized peptide with nif11-like leader